MSIPIGIFTGTRAEYGLLYPVIQRLLSNPRFTVRLFVSGSHLNDTYGNTIEEIQKDNVPIAEVLPLADMGQDMAYGCGAVCQQMTIALRNEPTPLQFMVVLGDRYETLGVATACLLSNIAVVHLHGGDVVRGGMMDEPIRHATTKMAHLHFPATELSAKRILAMGEEAWRVHVAGSPAVDNLTLISHMTKDDFVNELGLDPNKPWILFTQHPITTEPDAAGLQAEQTLAALSSLGEEVQIVATYPNHDKGSLAIIELLEKQFKPLPQFRIVKSLGRARYLNFLKYAKIVVGNSSSGLLETAHFKVPCINVGVRQEGRERGLNVVDVEQDTQCIETTLRKLLTDGGYYQQLQHAENPFGSGHCAETIERVLLETPYNQRLLAKQLTYEF